MSDLLPTQHAEIASARLDALVRELEIHNWCFNDTFAIEKEIADHAEALHIPRPLERPDRKSVSESEIDIWMKFRDPLTSTTRETLIFTMELAPPPASPGTVQSIRYLPLDAQAQQEFRNFVDHLKSELFLRASILAGSQGDQTPKSITEPISSDADSRSFSLRRTLSIFNAVISHPVVSGLIVVVVGGFIAIGIYTHWGFNLMDPSTSQHTVTNHRPSGSDTKAESAQPHQTDISPETNKTIGLSRTPGLEPPDLTQASAPQTSPSSATTTARAQTQPFDEFEIIRIQRARALSHYANQGVDTASPTTLPQTRN